MKKVRIISMLLALVTILLFATSCSVVTVSPGVTTTAKKDLYPNHMNVKLVVYSAVDKDSNGNYIKLAPEDQLPIIGAPNGFEVGYNNGDIVTAKMVIEQLASIRKATLTFAGNNVDTIKMSGTTHKTDSVVNTTRKGTVKEDPENNKSEDLPVYYIDMVMWEWKINDKAVSNIGDAEIKDGDSIVLTLILDNETKGQNYKLVSEYEAENGVNTEAGGGEEE